MALARALAVEPKVLLLDEPFGALDAKVRKDLRRWLRRLHDELHITTVFVTHDQEEAMEVADQIVVMDRGRIAQIGSVETVYEKPASPFVFEFLGNANVVPVEVKGREVFLPGSATPLVTDAIHESGKGALYVRPIDLRVGSPDQPGLEVIVDDVLRTGPLVHADARVVATGDRVQIEIPHLHHDTPSFVPGARFHLRLLQFSVYPAAAKPGPARRRVTMRSGWRRRGGGRRIDLEITLDELAIRRLGCGRAQGIRPRARTTIRRGRPGSRSFGSASSARRGRR